MVFEKKNLRCLPLTRLAAAVAALQLAVPAQALIVVSGDVSPAIPASGAVTGGLNVGAFATGVLRVDGGSTFSSDSLWLANGASTGDAAVLVTGAGSAVAVSASAGNLDVGGQGRGSLTVDAGASMVYGLPTTACANNCRVYVSNSAGSSGSLSVLGAGSSFSTAGRINIGLAAVFTVAGGSSTGTALVSGGAVVNSSGLFVANAGGGLGRLGTETVSGTVIVEGPGSAWNLVRVAGQAAASTPLDLAVGKNTTAVLTVRNGGRISVDGSAVPTQAVGVRVGVGLDANSNARATLNVDGAASRLEVNSDGSFFNVGSRAGSTGTVTVGNGGVVTGTGTLGLTYSSVGRDGGSGSLTVIGQDAAGVSSLFRIDGRASTGGGSFASIGRNDLGSSATGAVSVLAGGRFEVDTRGVVLTNGSLLSGAYVGYGTGGTASVTVSGLGAVTGAPSSFAVLGGAGLAPYVAVGRDGGIGTVLVSGGAQLLIDSQHASDPNATSNTSGNSLFLDIGRNSTASALASTGTVTVSGAGSAVTLSGTADRYLQVGAGNGGNGTLKLLDGGAVNAFYLALGAGAGAQGQLSMNGGVMTLAGLGTSANLKGLGGAVVVGNGGGVAAADLTGGSRLSVLSATNNPPTLVIGGSRNGPGGTGTVNVSGGSMLEVAGYDALLVVGRNGSASVSGFGVLDIAGAGSDVRVLSGPTAATATAGGIVVGYTTFTEGSINVGTGASLRTDRFISLAYNGSGGTGGSGRLIVNGTVTTPNLYVGPGGFLGGSGLVVGQVLNRGGIINPGNSPGTLRVDGGFDNSEGQLILEVKRAADGSYATDQLVLGDASAISFGSGQISFRFLDDTDPTAFQNSGQFSLKTFFKEVDGAGNVIDLPGSALPSFANVQFGAQADAYAISNFSFNAATGASFSATPVPQPPAAWLMGCGLLMLALRRLRTAR
jgi:T5SS/PEP-CTERM-associated repeat protein